MLQDSSYISLKLALILYLILYLISACSLSVLRPRTQNASSLSILEPLKAWLFLLLLISWPQLPWTVSMNYSPSLCVCVIHACVFMYVYICSGVCVFMHACICTCVLMYVCMCCACMHVQVYVHVFWCVCVYVVVKELPQVSSSIAFYPMF